MLTVVFFYDNLLLKKFGNDKEKARNKVLEITYHTEAIFQLNGRACRYDSMPNIMFITRNIQHYPNSIESVEYPNWQVEKGLQIIMSHLHKILLSILEHFIK